jgi:DNA polymerase III alpha subunit
MENTQKIADMTDLKIELNQLLFPNYQSPDEIKELYEAHKSEMVVTG